MGNIGVKYQNQNWKKIESIIKNILTEESVLNYPVEKLTAGLFIYLKNWLQYVTTKLKKHWDELENFNWAEELDKYAKEPFSKIAVLAVANIAVFAWLASSGTVAKLIPNYLNVYIPSALGQEIDSESPFSSGLRPESENKGIILQTTKLAGNDLSKAECEQDKQDGNGRCSDLCADIEQYIKVTRDMSDEEKSAWQKYINSKPRIASNLSNNPARISCTEPDDGHPHKSSQGKGKHMDEDCCPDPDEWPKPGCIYDARGLALMLKGPR